MRVKNVELTVSFESGFGNQPSQGNSVELSYTWTLIVWLIMIALDGDRRKMVTRKTRKDWNEKVGRTVIYLEEDHVPESLQVGDVNGLLGRVKLAVVDQAEELFEPLRHQQLSLADRRANLALRCGERTAAIQDSRSRNRRRNDERNNTKLYGHRSSIRHHWRGQMSSDNQQWR